MAKLIYSMLASLDGYVNDRNGKFDWGQAQDVEYLVHSNEQAMQIGTGGSHPSVHRGESSALAPGRSVW